MLNVNREPTPSALRVFGLTVFGGFVVLGAVFWWLGRADGAGLAWTGSGLHWAAIVLWIVGAIMLALTLGAQGLGRRVYVVWMTMGALVGTVTTFVLLSVLFVVFLPWFSLIRFKDPLRLKLARRGDSYWEPPDPHESTLERMIRPF